MINFNSNLYKNEWLELVFLNRNKTYGAYELRQHNNQTTIKALIIASTLFTSLIVSPLIYDHFFKGKTVLNPVDDIETVVTLFHPTVKPVIPLPPSTPAEPVHTRVNPPMVVVPVEQASIQLAAHDQSPTSANSSVPSEGSGVNSNPAVSDNVGPVTPTGEEPTEDISIYTGAIEAYPEFPGGLSAFSKYLSKNLRYPSMAQDDGIYGRVVLSFVIEKNGDLSNIKVLQGIGGGCDEEAIRVLKNSPTWKPGQQNKQKVRVAYTMPIVFNLPN